MASSATGSAQPSGSCARCGCTLVRGELPGVQTHTGVECASVHSSLASILAKLGDAESRLQAAEASSRRSRMAQQPTEAAVEQDVGAARHALSEVRAEVTAALKSLEERAMELQQAAEWRAEQRNYLVAERKRLDEDKVRWEREAAVAEEYNAGLSDIVSLSIGGERNVVVTRSTLTHFDSMLSAMFSNRHELATDGAGRVVINRDPKYFGYVLDFLRNGGVLPRNLPRDEAERERVKQEFQFFSFQPPVFEEPRAPLAQLVAQGKYRTETLQSLLFGERHCEYGGSAMSDRYLAVVHTGGSACPTDCALEVWDFDTGRQFLLGIEGGTVLSHPAIHERSLAVVVNSGAEVQVHDIGFDRLEMSRTLARPPQWGAPGAGNFGIDALLLSAEWVVAHTASGSCAVWSRVTGALARFVPTYTRVPALHGSLLVWEGIGNGLYAHDIEKPMTSSSTHVADIPGRVAAVGFSEDGSDVYAVFEDSLASRGQKALMCQVFGVGEWAGPCKTLVLQLSSSSGGDNMDESAPHESLGNGVVLAGDTCVWGDAEKGELRLRDLQTEVEAAVSETVLAGGELPAHVALAHRPHYQRRHVLFYCNAGAVEAGQRLVDPAKAPCVRLCTASPYI